MLIDCSQLSIQRRRRRPVALDECRPQTSVAPSVGLPVTGEREQLLLRLLLVPLVLLLLHASGAGTANRHGSAPLRSPAGPSVSLRSTESTQSRRRAHVGRRRNDRFNAISRDDDVASNDCSSRSHGNSSVDPAGYFTNWLFLY